VKHVSALAIASSTGGPQALQSLFIALKGCTRNIPVFITQHMPPTFTAILAEHLSKAAGLPCHEAKDNQRVEAGHVYLAPGDFHMQPERTSDGVVVRINQNPPENFCRPAADPMIRNLSAIYGNQLMVAVLTGMGHDGLQGSRKALEAGAEIIAQDQETCVVWGMPRAVTEAKIITQALPLLGLAEYITRAVTR
jgi:two-component system, chemotaxis family, protein-glutamate methylesterase/glutaminase